MTKPNLIRDTIRRLLLDMPGITHGQIVEKTGLAKNTVTKHVRAIRAEWEAKP